MPRAKSVTSDSNRPYNGGVPVTPTDDVTLAIPTTRGLYLGTGGDLSVILPDSDTPVLFKNAPQGYNKLQVWLVRASGTVAANIIALY